MSSGIATCWHESQNAEWCWVQHICVYNPTSIGRSSYIWWIEHVLSFWSKFIKLRTQALNHQLNSLCFNFQRFMNYRWVNGINWINMNKLARVDGTDGGSTELRRRSSTSGGSFEVLIWDCPNWAAGTLLFLAGQFDQFGKLMISSVDFGHTLFLDKLPPAAPLQNTVPRTLRSTMTCAHIPR